VKNLVTLWELNFEPLHQKEKVRLANLPEAVLFNGSDEKRKKEILTLSWE